MRQVALPQLFLVDVVIDINGLATGVTAQLLYEISGHSCPEKMSYEPVTTTMRCEPVLQLLRLRIVQANPFGVLFNHAFY